MMYIQDICCYAKNIKYENIIRLTTDNPLINYIKDLIKEFNKSRYKFMFIDLKYQNYHMVSQLKFLKFFFRSIKATNAKERNM